MHGLGEGAIFECEFQRCGVCVGCRAGNCGKCSCCLDMPRFGGTGGRRQPCKYRACSQLAVQVSSDWY